MNNTDFCVYQILYVLVMLNTDVMMMKMWIVQKKEFIIIYSLLIICAYVNANILNVL